MASCPSSSRSACSRSRLAGWWLGRPSRGLLGAIAAIWTVLVIGRYAEVTAPALYGREVNLYWDLQHVSGVAAMLATAAGRWLVIGVLAGVALVFVLLYTVLRWAFGRLGDAMSRDGERRALTVIATAMTCLVCGGTDRGAVFGRAGLLCQGAVVRTACHRNLRTSGPARLPRARGAHGRQRARTKPRDGFGLRADQRRGRPPALHRGLRRDQLRPAGIRRRSRGQPRRPRSRGSRHASPRGVGLRRIADLRWQLVARPHQPDVRRRGERSGYERPADDAEARHARHRHRAPRLSHGRRDARHVAGLAGRRVLRIRRDLRRRAARLPRPAVRMVGHSRPGSRSNS